jgi:transketolase N-terminal domain/subunit
MMIDELDARLIELLAAEPRVGVLEGSRRLGVARGTVQARLDNLDFRTYVLLGDGECAEGSVWEAAYARFVQMAE